jgi:glucosyl-dolichyl phosphate glucuronosyltransferase
MSETDISVVISTYNRCDMLPVALEGLLAQDASSVRYEVIVVDNNSTDRTRQVVATLIESGEARLRYVFEARQGLPHARNAGISVALAPIIAFTDDDVRVAPSWIAEIKRAFDAHPEVDSVGGRILPRWPREPPAWLTREHWVGPLALQDYGPATFYVNAERPLSLAGANMAFRRTVFERVGRFAPAFLGSSEDTEMLIRLWRSKLQSLYVPSILVTAEVQPERLTKAYHRSWFFRTGSVQALMRFEEIFDRDGRLDEERVARETLFGMPAFIYREFLTEGAGWLGAIVRRQESVAFTHENRLRYLVGYISRRYEQTRGERSRWGIAEVGIFAASVLKRKIRAVFGQMVGGAARSSANSPRRGRSGPRSSPNGDKDAPD